MTGEMEDHLQTQLIQLCTGNTICYALDSHYFRAELAGKSISWCQVYQTSIMQTARLEKRGDGLQLYIDCGGWKCLHLPGHESVGELAVPLTSVLRIRLLGYDGIENSNRETVDYIKERFPHQPKSCLRRHYCNYSAAEPSTSVCFI